QRTGAPIRSGSSLSSRWTTSCTCRDVMSPRVQEGCRGRARAASRSRHRPAPARPRTAPSAVPRHGFCSPQRRSVGAPLGVASRPAALPTRRSTMWRFLKDVTRHTSIYGMGEMASKVIGFFLLPLYTHFLTPADYGVLGLLYITMRVLDIVVI